MAESQFCQDSKVSLDECTEDIELTDVKLLILDSARFGQCRYDSRSDSYRPHSLPAHVPHERPPKREKYHYTGTGSKRGLYLRHR